VFLISKSNCAFINYKSEASCAAALARFHESRFQGTKLVCRLRRAYVAPPTGTPTGPRTHTGPSTPVEPAGSIEEGPIQIPGQEGPAIAQNIVAKVEEKFFVLKSLTVEDLDASVRSGSWATQSHNEAALNAAYKVN
jgi:YT521-B-like domain